MPATVHIGASTGERITIALVFLGLMAEVLSDNVSCQPQPQPITMDGCQAFCQAQGELVERYESYACACKPWPQRGE